MTTRSWARRRAGPPALVLAALVTFAATCGADTPEAQLKKALERTLRQPFSYAFTANADREALEALGPHQREVGLFLQGFKVSGRRSGDADAFLISLIGIDAVELRRLDEEHLFLRFGFDDLSALVGGGMDPAAQIVPLLRQRGVSDDVVEAVTAAFHGQWVGIQGRITSDELRGVLESESTESIPPEQGESLREALGGDVDGFVDRYLVVHDVSENDDERTFDVGMRVADLVRAVASVDPTSRVEDLEGDLAALPETFPGTVVTRDGVVTALVVDLAEAARSAGAQMTGSITARLDLAEHDKVEDIEPPEEAVTITNEQFLAALRAVSGLVEEVVPPRHPDAVLSPR